ncbi:unnamed protein product [Didymodactylos carnosus]|uniref:Uncharacterized protein n=1 Tax=Didymodactylos carnosus TaxID=1234261 RepID=A0A813PEG8_9BILA|nr:unnamed protein product [Didymodactylos carnosus]CAF0766298.1 unnamed protein product [Didymodactylos carnosus]CAF3531318.1 unnamed protein product [Didymodactylos carnosus]CAF3546604.1 unnamed protein product [Didymodactylos carnosus]
MGGHVELSPAELAKLVGYKRYLNTVTDHGRKNIVLSVFAGWGLFGYTMYKLSQSRKKNKPIDIKQLKKAH